MKEKWICRYCLTILNDYDKCPYCLNEIVIPLTVFNQLKLKDKKFKNYYESIYSGF